MATAEMAAAERELGPRWTATELRALFRLVQALGSGRSRQWDALAAKLPARTPAMVRALVASQSSYLSRPEASEDGFCAAMDEYYTSVGGDGAGASANPIHNATANGGTDADVKMEIVETSERDGAPHQQDRDGDMDGATRIRKRQDSLTPASAPTAAAGDDNASTLSTQPPRASSSSAPPSSGAKQDKKKRKLGRVLAWDAAGDHLDQQAQLQLQIRSDDDDGESDAVASGASGVSTRQRINAPTSSRSRAWLQDPSLAQLLRGSEKFALPWHHWFYSFVDSDFFLHNEFLDCLDRMGLAKITAAARPIWSSVRASMGRPRRLSARFFAQEKAKLENYRAIKRRIGLHKAPEGWPFRCVAPLEAGARVVVCQENPRRFASGVVQSYLPGSDVCTVRLSRVNGERSPVVAVTVDSVMVLDSSSLVKNEVKEENHHHQQEHSTLTIQTQQQQQQARPSVFQYNHIAGPEASEGKAPWASGDSAFSMQSHQHQHLDEKISAVIAVKELLHRKEQLVAALAKLNARVVLEQDAADQSSTASNRHVAITNMFSEASSWPRAASDRSILQRQYAWIVVNLDATNRSLQEALVRLQECSGNAQAPSSFGAQNASSSPSLPFNPDAQPQAMDVDASESSGETLSLHEMKWAVSFLAQSRKRSSDLVAASMAQMTAQMEAAGSSNTALEIHPETRQLISTSLCLMSVVRSGTAPSGVPPLITQKLMERLLELLEPRHGANLDLYAELRSAAEGVHTTLRQSSAMSHHTPPAHQSAQKHSPRI